MNKNIQQNKSNYDYLILKS